MSTVELPKHGSKYVKAGNMVLLIVMLRTRAQREWIWVQGNRSGVFIYLLNPYSLSIYYVPDTVLGT